MTSHARDDRPHNPRGGHTPDTARPDRVVTTLTAMTWTWHLEDRSGASLDPAALGVEVPPSDNQGDAESWLGENWRDLLARGVAAVSLFDGETRAYGPMGLDPA
jgi:hypothetical protein